MRVLPKKKKALLFLPVVSDIGMYVHVYMFRKAASV